MTTNFCFLAGMQLRVHTPVSLLIAVPKKSGRLSTSVLHECLGALGCVALKITCRRCLAGTYGRSCPVEVSHPMSPAEEGNGIC